MTALYRHFDEHGAILYVGISVNAAGMTGGPKHSLSAHLLPRGKSGGDRSSSQVAAASQAAPPRPCFPGTANSTGLRAGGFSSHPRETRAIRGGGPASPSGPSRCFCQSKAPAFAAIGTASGAPFVSNCLSQPRRGIVPAAGAPGGAA